MKYLQQFVTTSLNVGGGIDASQTTGIVLQSLNNIDATKPSVACLSWADPLNTSVAEWVTYTSINSTTNELQGVTRGAEGYSAKTHENTAVVAFPLSKAHVNELNDLLTSGSGAITATLDEDTMSSNSATALATQQSIKAYVDTYGNNESLYRQAIVNPHFEVAQLGSSFTSATVPANSDDTYTLDEWVLVSDGNDAVDISLDPTEKPTGSYLSMKLDVETAKRFGFVQFFDTVKTGRFAGKTVSLSLKVKSANISAIRMAVLTWGGTADSLTSDVVGTWADTPTWAANWTAENTPADLTVTSDWTTVKVENIAIDSATVNNMAVVFWLPNEETIGDIIYVADCCLNEGSVSLSCPPSNFSEEYQKCQHTLFTSYTYGTRPGTDLNVTSGESVGGTAQFPLFFRGDVATNTNRKYASRELPVKMRTTSPTCTFYDLAGNSGRVTTIDANAAFVADNIDEGFDGCESNGRVVHVQSAANCVGFAAHVVVSARL